MARLLFFGKLGDLAGARAMDFALGAATNISSLKAAIAAQYPDLGDGLAHASVRCIVNEAVAHADASISDEDEIAFIPPVSGG